MASHARRKLGFEERRQREYAAAKKYGERIDGVRAAVKAGDTVMFHARGNFKAQRGRVLEAEGDDLIILDKQGARHRSKRIDVDSILRAAPRSKRAPGYASGHMLDRVGSGWKSGYSGERKPVILMSDREISEKFGVRDVALVITTRNVARSVAAALARGMRAAKLEMRPRDAANIASKQIRTMFDGGSFGSSRDPFKIWIWFENGGPLADASYHPDFGRVYDAAVTMLGKQGFRASWDSQNAAMSYIHAVPRLIA